MKKQLEQKLQIVTGIGDDGRALLKERTIDKLLDVLFRRANRLVNHREIREKLIPAFREFVYNIVEYFSESDELGEYVMTNIMTALATSDNHGASDHGDEDYSTFIRRLNPTDPEADDYFVIGRAGNINGEECPLEEIEKNSGWLLEMPKAKLHVFYAFHYARSKDPTRDAPRIPVEDFLRLVPKEIHSNPILEEAFLDVGFSDGAWELYQLKLAEDIDTVKMVA